MGVCARSIVLTYRYNTPVYVEPIHMSIRVLHQVVGIDLRARALSHTENSQEDKIVVSRGRWRCIHSDKSFVWSFCEEIGILVTDRKR
jgi:hypothetical protein